MKKHYATKKIRHLWYYLFGYARLRDVMTILVVIFALATHQYAFTVHYAFASSDTSGEEVQEENDDVDDDEEEDEENEDDEDEKNDDEVDDENGSDDSEDESDTDEQGAQTVGDESGEEEMSDDHVMGTDVLHEDIASDGTSSEGVSQENEEQKFSETSAFSQEDESMEFSDNDEIPVDNILEESECSDDCPEVQIINVNDAEIVTDINVNADTGNNIVNENGDNVEDIVRLCDENWSDNECDDVVENGDCTYGETDKESGDGSIGEMRDCIPTENDEESIGEDDLSYEENDELIEQGNGSEENMLSSAERNTEEQETVSEIITGDVTNVVNILQQVNTNIVGTNWTQLIYDLRDIYDADIDLFSLFEELLKNADDTVIPQLLDVYNHNTATITNTVTVSSNTGGNAANDNVGNVSIETGDVISGVNIVNLVNQNLIGNNWLFAVINVFGQWSGDLIVPGEGLLSGDSTQMNDVNVTNENTAYIDDTVMISAHTGNNAANNNAGDVSMETGNAISVTNVAEVVNTNIIANNWFFLMINNMGTWTGNVLRWNNENNIYTTVFQYVFGGSDTNVGQQCDDCNTMNVHNDNTAVISNTVTVHADTGNNVTNGNSGSAHITTGDAIAWANIFNLINTNIVGSNWMFSIVNVMNEWSGDVVFAYPDLAITIDDTRDVATVGDELHYAISYQNIGEATAESVMIAVFLPGDVRYHGERSENGESLIFDVGKVVPGSGGNITLVATVNTDIGPEDVVLSSSAQITTETAEVDMENNRASDQTSVIYDLSNDNVGGLGQNFFYEWDIDPELSLRRTSNIVGPVKAGDLVIHQIVVENTGDSPVYDIILTEEVESVDGTQLITYEWDAGYLLEGESAIIDYAVIVSGGMAANDYHFSASAEGVDAVDDEVESNGESIMMTVASYISPIALADEINDLPSFVPEVHAYDSNVIMDSSKEIADQSFWAWMIALLLYALVINWTLFPQRRKKII